MPGRSFMSFNHPSKTSDPPRSTVELPHGVAAYTDEGQGPPVLMVHGLPGSVRDFRYLAPHVAEAHRVVRIDLPGFGETPANHWGLSPAEQARFIVTLMNAIELDDALVVGHSAGGIFSCALATLAPQRVRALALLAGNGLRPNRALRRAPIRTMARLLERPLLARALTPLLRSSFKRMGFRGFRDDTIRRTVRMTAATGISTTHADTVRAVTQPCLVAYCEDDELMEPEIAHELAAAVPNGPRLFFPDGGHQLQKHRAKEISAALIDWYGELQR
jgi:pimeloyl-ACP methyl ester carboxylesterase